MTQNPNRAWGGFDLSGVLLRDRLSNRSRTRPGCCKSFNALLREGDLSLSFWRRTGALMQVSLETHLRRGNYPKVQRIPQKWQAEK